MHMRTCACVHHAIAGAYVGRLRTYQHIYATGLDWAGEATFLQAADMLRSGQMTAYVYDRPLLLYWMAK